MGEMLEAGLVKFTQRAAYEQMNEKLQHLITTFHSATRRESFKRARSWFNFLYYY
jgi:hypothetical protein